MFIGLGLRSAITVGLKVDKNPGGLIAFVRDLFAGFFVLEVVGLDEFEKESDKIAILEFLDDAFCRHEIQSIKFQLYLMKRLIFVNFNI